MCCLKITLGATVPLVAGAGAHGPHSRLAPERGRGDTETSMLPLRKAPYAFKDLMTHVLQFALRIAFRCVLHRRKSQDIRC